MKVICFHQSVELYGSDRSFLQVIQYLKASCRFSKITVVLPEEGDLVQELLKIDIDVTFLPMSLLSRTLVRNFRWGRIFFPLVHLKSKYHLIRDFDLVYINTSVIFDLYLLMPFLKIKKIIHVREIPQPLITRLLSLLVRVGNMHVIFNSIATQKAFGKLKKSFIVHNGFEGFKTEDSSLNSNPLKSQELKVLLIGRVNDWKGQEFTISAISSLSEDEKVKLRIVGSTSVGNEGLLEKLKEKVKILRLGSKVEFIEFQPNPLVEFQWADIVIVPSLKPEPFGRIAIEAMSLKKPVIGTNHGGLTEIVAHGKTGFLFAPNNTEQFLKYLKIYIKDRALIQSHGKNSYNLFEKKFSSRTLLANLEKVFAEVLGIFLIVYSSSF